MAINKIHYHVVSTTTTTTITTTTAPTTLLHLFIKRKKIWQ